MVDHVVFLFYWNMRWQYHAGFWASFSIFVVATLAKKRMQASHGVTLEPHLDADGIAEKLRRGGLKAKHRTTYYHLELIEMVSENGMFLCFISGMASGFADVRQPESVDAGASSSPAAGLGLGLLAGFPSLLRDW